MLFNKRRALVSAVHKCISKASSFIGPNKGTYRDTVVRAGSHKYLGSDFHVVVRAGTHERRPKKNRKNSADHTVLHQPVP